MVQSAEISPAGAGTVAIERTSHVVESDGSVYDLYTLTDTAAPGYKFSHYEVRFEHSYNNGRIEFEDLQFSVKPVDYINEQTQTPDSSGYFHNIRVVRIIAYFTQETGGYDGVLRNEDGTILRNASGVVLIGAEYRP